MVRLESTDELVAAEALVQILNWNIAPARVAKRLVRILGLR
jgi:hypothetical protein